MLETIENKATGLIAAGAVVPFTMAAMSKLLVGSAATTEPMLPTGLAMLPIGAMDISWFLNILAIPFGVAIFAVVWMASHAINVLILLSPWGAIDAALKSARTGLLAILAMTSALNPWAGAALSVAIIIVAYFVAGWAGRLSVFGWVFCWDFITRRRCRFHPADNNNRMFAGGNLPGVPARTYGRLVRQSTGNYEFIYQLWPWKPVKSAAVPATGETLAVGRGLFFSTIIEDDTQTLFLLPPRYRGSEDMIAQVMGWAVAFGMLDFAKPGASSANCLAGLRAARRSSDLFRGSRSRGKGLRRLVGDETPLPAFIAPDREILESEDDAADIGFHNDSRLTGDNPRSVSDRLELHPVRIKGEVMEVGTGERGEELGLGLHAAIGVRVVQVVREQLT